MRVYERTILNRIAIYLVRQNVDGSEVVFRHAPFYDRMLAGAALDIPGGRPSTVFLRVSEYLSSDDVYAIRHLAGDSVQSLSGMQVNHFTIFTDMTR